MELEFTETQRLLRDTLRAYMTREIEPLVAEMEAERLLPFEPIRKLVGDLGLDGGAGELADLAGDSAPEDHLGLFLPRIVPIEMSRVCAGLCMSYGASVGLAGGNVQARGNEEQKRRWGAPLGPGPCATGITSS
jgi:alkylation response protein AidB-like acyl-CoA dehydrogenase